MRAGIGMAVLFACGMARAADPAALRGIELTGTDGRAVDLARYAGRPAILFYEDRGSTSLNQPVKDALFARGRRDGMLAAASVIAVANIAAYNFFPARDIATAFIRRAEATAGIPILLDVDGTLMAAPWNLPDDTSTVLLLDRHTRIVSRHSGKLSAAETERLLDRLAELARDLSPASPAPTPHSTR